jgi:putative ABC transport system substrate-binding protein
MRRREFITLLGSAAATWPVGARAQQPKIPVVGFLNGGTPDGYAPCVTGFIHGLNETGYIENKNVTMDYRWAKGQYDRLQPMAADLVHLKVALIAANTPTGTGCQGGNHRDSDCLCQYRRSGRGRSRREF